MDINERVTLERVTEAVEASHTDGGYPGFCIACGAEVDGVEPDASEYSCDSCHKPGVYGAEELLLMLS